MMSTLRIGARPSLRTCWAAAQFRSSGAYGRLSGPHLNAVSARARQFCSEEPNKKPPKGFESFYRGAKDDKPKEKAADKESAEKADGSKAGPGETAKKDAAKDTSAEPSDKTDGGAPGETPSGSKRDPKGNKGKKKSEKKGPEISSEMSMQSTGVIVGIALFMLYMQSQAPAEGEDITIQELLREYLVKGYVEKIQIVNKTFCRAYLRQDVPQEKVGKVLTMQLGTPEAFEMKLEHLQFEMGLAPFDHVPIQYVNETDYAAELMPYLPSMLILIPLIFAARAMSSGMGGMGGMGGGGGQGPGGRNMFSMGKAFPNGHKDVKSTVKFKDVAGQEQAKREVMEFVDFLKDPTKYEKLGAKIPKGGLLVGPPGTGKTLLAKATAGEADCPFYSISGSDFIEMFVGVGPSRVRDLFQQARASAPSIVFIDEIDAVGRKRGKGGAGGGNDERENTLNQLLVEMDGFSSSTGVVVLAGTNRADVLDPALTRPGRFDRQIAVDRPDLREREAIFKVHLKPVKLHAELSTDSVAKRMAALTPGFAGSDIANICNEAAIHGARRNAESVEMNDFERATERVMGGLPKENNLMNPKEKRTVALHECGHAIVGWFLEHSDPLLKVSIVPRSNGALGFAQYLPDEIRLYPMEAILDKIAVSLGGRAAEELFVGRISTGASDDLDKVTKMAYSIVSVYGMNTELGLVSFSQNDPGNQFYKPYSEDTAQLIDREARKLVDEQYERVKRLLQEKETLMHSMADMLCERETIVYNEILGCLGPRPYAVKAEYNNFVTAGGGNPFTAGMGDQAENSTSEPAKSENSSSESAPAAGAESAKKDDGPTASGPSAA